MVDRAEELRRLAQADRIRLDDEQRAREEGVRKQARADLDGWRRCIERTIRNGGDGKIFLSDRMSEDLWNREAPFVRVNLKMNHLLLIRYAAELQRALGEPFKVSCDYLDMPVPPESELAGKFTCLVVEW
jgi:hypothetical protein